MTDFTRIALGSWADEMETQPIPAVPAPYSSRGDRDGGERRAFTQPAWEQWEVEPEAMVRYNNI